MRAAAIHAAGPGAQATATGGHDRFEQGYAAVRADPGIQFDFPMLHVPRNPPPKWLIDLLGGIGRFIGWVGNGWTWLFWGLVALIVLIVIVALVPPLRRGAVALWHRLRRRKAAEAAPATWRPEAAVARQLLAEADVLAAQGQYDEAVHLILFRSIEDIEAWRGDVVRPSLTSRDIARADALPDAARGVFGRIVAAVERSLFAGRPLGAEDWHAAREDYSRFALKAAA